MKLKKIFVPNHPDLQDSIVADLRVIKGQKIKYNHFIVGLLQTNGISVPILSPYAGLVREVAVELNDIVSPGAFLLSMEVDTALDDEDEEERELQAKRRILEEQIELETLDFINEEEKPLVLPEEKKEIKKAEVAKEKIVERQLPPAVDLPVGPVAPPPKQYKETGLKKVRYFNIDRKGAAEHFFKQQQRRTEIKKSESGEQKMQANQANEFAQEGSKGAGVGEKGTGKTAGGTGYPLTGTSNPSSTSGQTSITQGIKTTQQINQQINQTPPSKMSITSTTASFIGSQANTNKNITRTSGGPMSAATKQSSTTTTSSNPKTIEKSTLFSHSQTTKLTESSKKSETSKTPDTPKSP